MSDGGSSLSTLVGTASSAGKGLVDPNHFSKHCVFLITQQLQYQALDASSQETDTISVGACARFCHNSYMASGDFSVGFEIEVDSLEKLCRCLVSAFPDEADGLERCLTESEDVPHTGSARELFYGMHDESDPPVSADGVSFCSLCPLS